VVPGEGQPKPRRRTQVKTHGHNGWLRGCRCDKCEEGHEIVLARREETKKQGESANPPRGTKGLERATWLEIQELALDGTEYARWRQVALMAAKTADDCLKESKPHIFNGAIKTLTEAMDRLHALKTAAVGKPGGGEGASGDFVDAYLDS
jgi:hypothetical protein